MVFIKWDEKFSLGVEQFDEHHQHLIDLLNKTHEEFINLAPKYSLDKTLDELLAYATFHFSAEERWMKNINYPDLEKHCKEHAFFRQRITKMRKDFADNKGSLSLEVLSFMKKWVATHIQTTDTKYGRYFSQIMP